MLLLYKKRELLLLLLYKLLTLRSSCFSASPYNLGTIKITLRPLGSDHVDQGGSFFQVLRFQLLGQSQQKLIYEAWGQIFKVSWTQCLKITFKTIIFKTLFIMKVRTLGIAPCPKINIEIFFQTIHFCWFPYTVMTENTQLNSHPKTNVVML